MIMPSVSSIKRLPPALRTAIAEQLEAGRTLDEITAQVKNLGAEVSRSAIGRYKMRLDAMLERSRQTRQIAEVLASTVGKNGTAELVKGNAELLHGLLLAAAENAASSETAIDSKDAMMLAVALEKLASAAKKGAELERMQADAAATVMDTEGTAPSKQIEIVFVAPQKKQDA